MHRPFRLAIVAVASALLAGPGCMAPRQPPGAIAVAAASDLQTALPDLAARFERDTGSRVTVSFGSSGNFAAQIRNGAPFDVFLSADIDYPQQLARDGLAEPGSLYEYAIGRLVVWTRKDSGIDVSRGLKALTDPRVRRIAIASPEHAPYGRAAVAALRHERVYEAVQPKLVLGENVSQAAQLCDSGNADAGIIALSLALGPALSASGTYAEVPADAHPPVRQAAIVVSASRAKPTAHAFVDHLKRPDVAQQLQHFGFSRSQ